LARALVAANPSACLWGSDWPHTDTVGLIRTGDLLAALEAWCPDSAARARVTIDAASALFASA